jgi:hypothetical protein
MVELRFPGFSKSKRKVLLLSLWLFVAPVCAFTHAQCQARGARRACNYGGYNTCGCGEGYVTIVENGGSCCSNTVSGCEALAGDCNFAQCGSKAACGSLSYSTWSPSCPVCGGTQTRTATCAAAPYTCRSTTYTRTCTGSGSMLVNLFPKFSLKAPQSRGPHGRPPARPRVVSAIFIRLARVAWGAAARVRVLPQQP